MRSLKHQIVPSIVALLLANGPVQPASACADCNVELEDDRLVIENAAFRRIYDWNNGQLISRSIVDKSRGQRWLLAAESADFAFPGEAPAAANATLATREVSLSSTRPAHVLVQIDYDVGPISVRRQCRVFSQVPALPCEFYLKRNQNPDDSGLLQSWREDRDAVPQGQRKMVEDPHAAQADSPHAVLERLALPGKHWRLTAAAFNVATDYNDTLVQYTELSLYRKDNRLQGNLLALENALSGEQLFILKESPSKADQLYYPGYDFVVRHQDVRVVGLGVDAQDISTERWVRGHGVVTGLAAPGRLSLLTSLRQYLETQRAHISQRDDMILMNTWGDRNRDGRVRESFILEELRAAAKLGVTHFQIDDGWQAGLSSNSASDSGKLWTDWSAASWQPHPKRFPNGLGPVVRAADSLGIELGIWFNPSSVNNYASWQRDADILLDLYRRHGISVFKIDGIDVQTKQADVNLRRFFERVQSASGGEVVFNLDVTAGRRPGYFHMTEYGNIFLENRYTDWANYYPYRTLRNLWMLSAYVPSQRLQIEFLNKWRNPDKYSADDPLAPANIPFDYQFAVTMFAQPLAWFEATGLPDEAQRFAPIMRQYKALQSKIHQGRIFPIGDRPDGTRWTGFQSMLTDKEGYLLVLREFNAKDESSVSTWLTGDKTVQFQHVLGHGKSFDTATDSQGRVGFRLNQPHSYALYRYTIQ